MSGPASGRADVVIVGATAHGLAAATWLARQAVSVVVLEAATDVDDSDSARHPGHAFVGLVEHPWRLVASLGQAGARDLYRFSDESLDLLDDLVGFERTGLLWAAVEPEREPEELIKSHAALTAMGVPCALWDVARVDEATGATGLGPGLWLPRDGLVDAPDVMRRLAVGATAAGAVVRTGTGVLSVSPSGQGAEVITADGGWQAEIVVLAAEAGLRHLDATMEETLTPVREASLRFAARPAMSVGLRAGFGYTTARVDAEGFVLAGCRWATPHMEAGETDASHVAPAVEERMQATAARFFPGAGQASSRRAWITAHPCDGLPLIGPLPGDSRRIACAGFAGNELGLGLRAARAVVDGLMTGTATGVPRMFDATRFLP